MIKIIVICTTILAVFSMMALGEVYREQKLSEMERSCVEAGGSWHTGFFRHMKCKMPRKKD